MKLKLVSIHEMTLHTSCPVYLTFSLQEPTSHVDDEYARAGIFDPKILITTSRDPSSRLQQFSKEMRLVFPNSQRINRGNHVMKEIVDACRANEVTDLIILHEHRGQPGKRSTHIGPPFHTANA
jgi:hypothetical protein